MTKLDTPSSIVTQRANAVKKAIAEICKLRVKQQVINVLSIQNRPRTDAVYDLLLNSLVLV